MAEKLDPKQMVSFEELLMSNVYIQEALINLLEEIKRPRERKNSHG